MFLRKLFFILVVFTFINSASAQKIWDGDLQAQQLELFYSDNYTEITGNLNIKNTNLKKLEQLHNLTKVGGNILIFNNDSLTSLEGLEELLTVGGKISIRENKHLNNYCALSKDLILSGITGEEVNKNIFDKFDTQDNEYDPDRNDIIEGECEYYSPLLYFSL